MGIRSGAGMLSFSWALALLCLVGCDSMPGQGSLKVIFEHSYGGELWIEAILEDNSGISLDAATVVLEFPDATALLLDYDSDVCRYTSSVDSPLDGAYTISARSAGLWRDIDLELDFVALREKPVIADVSDSLGNSAGAGETLSSAASILVDGDAMEGVSVYKLYVYSSASLDYSEAATDFSFVIPEDTLTAGNYTAIVEAQIINGDPLLTEADYYAASVADSSSYVFVVE